MTAYCRFCGVSNFRTSRFRLGSDLSRLLILRLPVRCRVCDERTSLFLPQFLKMRNEHRTRHAENRGTT